MSWGLLTCLGGVFAVATARVSGARAAVVNERRGRADEEESDDEDQRLRERAGHLLHSGVLRRLLAKMLSCLDDIAKSLCLVVT